MMTVPRDWQHTGFQQEIDARSLPSDPPPYNPATREHLWIWILVFRANPTKVEDDPTHTPMMDRENLLALNGPGCYYCEQEYSRRLTYRPCPGDPTLGRRARPPSAPGTDR